MCGDERLWAKLCLERSPQDEATVVSVVTRGLSDDCTSESVEGDSLWQSPTGPGCAVTFDDLSFGTDPPEDLRDGS